MFVRSADSYRGQPPRRRGAILVAGLVFLIYLVLTGMSTVWTDYLWYSSVGYAQVWWIDLSTSLALGAAGVVVTFLVVWGNLVLADRLSPRMELLNLGDDEEMIERFREWVEPRLRLVRLGIAGAFGLLLGTGLAAWRSDFLLFMNPTEFGIVDPQFGRDLSFFMFDLPIWSDLVDWLFALVALTLIMVGVLHYLNGGIRIQRGASLSMRQGVKIHLSVLAAVAVGIRALAYRIDTYELLYRAEGFFGAGYTDINARLPALQLLALVSLVAAALLIANIWRKGWTLALVSLGGWILVSLIAGLVYPAIVQRFQVNPNELARERPYIDRNIEATRMAYDLDEVEVRPYGAAGELTVDDIDSNRITIDNLRMWDPNILTRTYRNLQEIRSYYRVDRVDTDRYLLDGVPTQVMISARELEDTAEVIPNDWQNQRLIYTHGFGAVVSPANTVESDGQPQLIVRDIPPIIDVEGIELEQSRIYFGETYSKPVIVRTGDHPQEVDFPLEGDTVLSEYGGSHGIVLDGIFKRLAFALRYRDLNILISSQLKPDSRVLMERNVKEMINKIAPFLATDSDPYPVILDDRIVWVVDLYTWSSRYPYSEPAGLAQTERLARISGLPRTGLNYVRNSVKATVDAYDGEVTFYVVDPDDPLIQSWNQVYTGVFKDASEMPADLAAHLRYPQDLFKIQSDMYLDYHVSDTDEFFRRVDAWAIPRDPSTPARGDLLWGDRVSADGRSVTYLDSLMPYYLMLSLPGEEGLSYVLTQPFTPQDKFNMSSILMADATPERYGRLVEYRLPRGSLVEGTGQVGDRIEQNDEISSQFTLWRGQGSEILLGDMLVVPVEESILYVQPVYLEAQQGGLPEFRRVVVVHRDRIEWGSTLDEALALIFGESVGPPDDGPEVPAEDVMQLLEQAQAAFERANTALRAGNLAEYQRLIEEAESLVEQAIGKVEAGVEAAVQPSKAASSL